MAKERNALEQAKYERRLGIGLDVALYLIMGLSVWFLVGELLVVVGIGAKIAVPAALIVALILNKYLFTGNPQSVWAAGREQGWIN